jgi:predicted esterase
LDAGAWDGDALDAPSEVTELPVPRYLPAYVSVPRAHGSRPVVVAVHGVGDRPDGQCVEWRRIVGDRAWVLCPRGIVSTEWSTRTDTRWTWTGPVFMKREIDAGLAALADRWGPFVDETRMVYAGFSYGAANGVAIVAAEPARFPYVVLTEGGADRWTPDAARSFAKAQGGTGRVLFVCGQESCATDAFKVIDMLHARGVDTKLENVEHQGHRYGGPVADRIRREWNWVTRGDPRWRLGDDPLTSSR